MMTPEIARLQDGLIYAISNLAFKSRGQIVLNYEIKESHDGCVTGYMVFYTSEPQNGDFEKNDISMVSQGVDRFFIELRNLMSRPRGDYWTTCDLMVEKTGHYNFKLSCDPPKRLNCVFDDDSLWRFNRYLETYKAERQSQKTQEQDRWPPLS